jgi:ABC-type nitrate/sulfonate/bicarbonate transport system substrate-binding protein
MEATLDLMLMRGGVALDQVKREKVPDTPVGYALIGAGRIDGYMGNVSTAVRLKNADPEVSVWKVDDGIPGQVYVATREMIEKEPEVLVRFLRAVHRSASAILDAEDLTPVMEAIGSQFEIRTLAEPEVAVQDLRANAELWVAHGRENLLRNVPERWAGAVADMRRANIISKDVDPAMLYDNALLEKALA